jgi:hypothetical protein
MAGEAGPGPEQPEARLVKAQGEGQARGRMHINWRAHRAMQPRTLCARTPASGQDQGRAARDIGPHPLDASGDAVLAATQLEELSRSWRRSEEEAVRSAGEEK